MKEKLYFVKEVWNGNDGCTFFTRGSMFSSLDELKEYVKAAFIGKCSKCEPIMEEGRNIGMKATFLYDDGEDDCIEVYAYEAKGMRLSGTIFSEMVDAEGTEDKVED